MVNGQRSRGSTAKAYIPVAITKVNPLLSCVSASNVALNCLAAVVLGALLRAVTFAPTLGNSADVFGVRPVPCAAESKRLAIVVFSASPSLVVLAGFIGVAFAPFLTISGASLFVLLFGTAFLLSVTLWVAFFVATGGVPLQLWVSGVAFAGVTVLAILALSAQSVLAAAVTTKLRNALFDLARNANFCHERGSFMSTPLTVLYHNGATGLCIWKR